MCFFNTTAALLQSQFPNAGILNAAPLQKPSKWRQKHCCRNLWVLQMCSAAPNFWVLPQILNAALLQDKISECCKITECCSSSKHCCYSQNKFLNVAKCLLQKSPLNAAKMSRILQICRGHKHKWLTQFGAGPAIARFDTMLNTMLKHTHGVWGR